VPILEMEDTIRRACRGWQVRHIAAESLLMDPQLAFSPPTVPEFRSSRSG
jgi:hypothetical protein